MRFSCVFHAHAMHACHTILRGPGTVFSTGKQPLAPLELTFAFFYGMLTILAMEWRRVCRVGGIAAPI